MKIRASTRAATPEPSPFTWGPTITSRRFRSRRSTSFCREVARWLDEPFGDASILPTHLLSRFARNEVKVILGGDGADELLAGYPTFAAERAAGVFRRLPRSAQALAGAAARRLPVDHRNFSFDFKIKQFLRGAAEPLPLAHQRWMGSFSGAEIAELLVGGDAIDVEHEHLRRARLVGGGADPLSRSLALYQDTYLPEDILTKVDRASMACGLEVRAPFLDAEAGRLRAVPAAVTSSTAGTGPSDCSSGPPRAGCRPSILARPKKGFGIPVASWLRGPLAPLDEPSFSAASGSSDRASSTPTMVARRIAEHQSGRHDHRKPLWTLLIFQLWCDHWLG